MKGAIVASRPFVIPVSGLRRTLGSRRHVTCEGPVPDLACSGSWVPDDTEPRADVTIESVAGGVAVAGTITVVWTGPCRRCLEPATGTEQLRVRELYLEDGDGEETYRLVDDRVDLEPLVRDAVLLELPQAPLCRPECLGLCPVCGVNRNLERCACRPPADPRWVALDVLR
jgi:uncharacterized protein